MSAPNAPYLSKDTLLSYLRGIYPGREVITSTEFRAFLNISAATDQRMRAKGVYPRTISLPGVMRDPRIMLVDLAVWLEQGGCPETGTEYRKRGRGSDAWKKNHPPKTAAEPAPETSPEPPVETSSAVPPEIAPETTPEASSEPSSEAVSEATAEKSSEQSPITPSRKTRKKPSKAAPEAVADGQLETAPEATA